MTENDAKAGLDPLIECNWNIAKERVGNHVSVDSPDYWPNMRKHYRELYDMPPEKPLQNGAKETAKELLQRGHGPGEAILIPRYSLQEQVLKAKTELFALPNAFDPLTGALNTNNQKAVILYALIEMLLSQLSTQSNDMYNYVRPTK